MKKSVLVFCFLILSFSVFANPLAKIYSTKDSMYSLIERLSIESGIAPPTSASPWSGYELYSHLERINPLNLSPQGKKLYEELKHALLGEDQEYPFQATGYITPELYVNLNHENISDRDWVYDCPSRQPFGYLRTEGVIGNHLYGIFTVELRARVQDMYSDGGEKNLWIANMINNAAFSLDSAEHGMPYTAFASYSEEGFTAVAGRDTLSWGRGKTGNLFLGGHAPYHDHIAVSAFGDILTYRFLAMQFDEIDSDTGGSRRLSFADDIRLFTAHRLEARITPRLTIAATEGALFYSSRMDLRMFSPLMFLHNYFNFSETKNFMHFDFEYVVSPGVYAYTQLFIDQLQLPGEVDSYDEKELFPNAFGVLGGVQFVKPVRDGYLTAYAEAALTSTYLYMRRNISDDKEVDKTYSTNHWNLDLVQATNISRTRGVHFAGYRYGPDTIIASANIKYEEANRYTIFADVTFGIQGEKGLKYEGKDQIVDTGIKYLYQILPSGGPEYFLKTGIGGEYTLSQFPVTLYSQVNTINRWHNMNEWGTHIFDIQAVIGANIGFHFF